MACQRPRNMDGIRFLDESPDAEAPPPKGKGKDRPRKRREWPVGTIAFLAVVGIGSRAEAHGRRPGQVDGPGRNRAGILGRSRGLGSKSRPSRGRSACIVGTTARSRAGSSVKPAARRTWTPAGHSDSIRVVIDGGPELIRVRVDCSAGDHEGDGGAEVRLDVPSGADVRVVTRNGPVRVEEVEGSVAVRTTNGRIEVEDGRGLLVLETSNGAIDCEAEDALIDAETSNGSIELPGLAAIRDLPAGHQQRLGHARTSRRTPLTPSPRDNQRAGRLRFPDPRPRRMSGSSLIADNGAETRVVVRTSNGGIRIEED